MSTTNLILAENPNFKLVEVSFSDTNTQNYTYKTLFDVAAGDLVVVYARNKFKVVEVVKIKDPYEMDLSATFEYKWITSVVDTVEYERHLELEREINKHINALEFEAKRNQFKAQLQNSLGDKKASKLLKEVKES